MPNMLTKFTLSQAEFDPAQAYLPLQDLRRDASAMFKSGTLFLFTCIVSQKSID